MHRTLQPQVAGACPRCTGEASTFETSRSRATRRDRDRNVRRSAGPVDPQELLNKSVIQTIPIYQGWLSN